MKAVIIQPLYLWSLKTYNSPGYIYISIYLYSLYILSGEYWHFLIHHLYNFDGFFLYTWVKIFHKKWFLHILKFAIYLSWNFRPMKMKKKKHRTTSASFPFSIILKLSAYQQLYWKDFFDFLRFLWRRKMSLIQSLNQYISYNILPVEIFSLFLCQKFGILLCFRSWRGSKFFASFCKEQNTLLIFLRKRWFHQHMQHNGNTNNTTIPPFLISFLILMNKISQHKIKNRLNLGCFVKLAFLKENILWFFRHWYHTIPDYLIEI